MEPATLFAIQLSLKTALISTVLVFVFGSLLAYALTRTHFWGKSFLEVFLMIPLVLPPTVIGHYLILIIGRNGLLHTELLFTWKAGVIASFVVSLPLFIQAAKAAIAAVDHEMIATSKLMGYNELETILYVILPLARRGLFAGLILSFARALGEFGATLMVAGNIPEKTATMPLTIYSLASSGEWNEANQLAILLTLLSALFLLPIIKWRHP